MPTASAAYQGSPQSVITSKQAEPNQRDRGRETDGQELPIISTA
jgi:hypothetical protein